MTATHALQARAAKRQSAGAWAVWPLAGWIAVSACSAQEPPRIALPAPETGALVSQVPEGPEVRAAPVVTAASPARPAASAPRLPDVETVQLPAPLTSPAVGGAQVWQQSMVWQRRERAEIGLGLAVVKLAQPLGPLAAQRGADTTGVNGPLGAAALVATGPAMAVLVVGRPIVPGVALDVGMGLTLANGTGMGPGSGLRAAWAGGQGDALGDGAAALLPRGELRMGLSFGSRRPYDELRRGLVLRMELSRATSLTVRPRSGRVSLQLNSHW